MKSGSETNPLSPEKLARIVETLNRENEQEERRIERKVREAHAEVRRLVARFREIDPGLKKVVLFGSLAEGRVSSLEFDIDLAVISEEYLKLVACALRSPFRVDVLDYEQAAAPISSRIDTHGRILYEKKES